MGLNNDTNVIVFFYLFIVIIKALAIAYSLKYDFVLCTWVHIYTVLLGI